MEKEQILEAKYPEDVFGGLEDAQRSFRKLASEWHPDRDGGDTEVFQALSALWAVAQSALRDGTYGRRLVISSPIRIQTRRHAYSVDKILEMAPVCNIYEGQDESDDQVLIKISRSVADNNLLVREARVIKKILKGIEDMENPPSRDNSFLYVPQYIESFGYKSPKDKRPRQANIFKSLPYRFYSLEEVHRQYPVLNPKDMAWMMRRLLEGLAIVHQQGEIHGAITPNNVLIQPENHGLVLQNWIHSPEEGQPIKTIEPSYRLSYPLEVREKEVPTPATDIYMVAKCMEYLVGTNCTSTPIKAFLKGSAVRRQSRRPGDAAKLLAEFTELVEQLWGPRRWRPFIMP